MFYRKLISIGRIDPPKQTRQLAAEAEIPERPARRIRGSFIAPVSLSQVGRTPMMEPVVAVQHQRPEPQTARSASTPPTPIVRFRDSERSWARRTIPEGLNAR